VRASPDDLERVYRDRLRQFVRVARALLGDEELARDAVQEAFARAVRARESFRGDGALDAWIARIVVTTARDVARANGRPADLDVESKPAAAPPPDDDDDVVRTAVRRLPERQRLALFLRYYADFDYSRIAYVLGVERGTVSATLHAAHARLAELLEEVRR
jgi:RNA polymerase sigma factor (sigma-70 family)